MPQGLLHYSPDSMLAQRRKSVVRWYAEPKKALICLLIGCLSVYLILYIYVLPGTVVIDEHYARGVSDHLVENRVGLHSVTVDEECSTISKDCFRVVDKKIELENGGELVERHILLEGFGEDSDSVKRLIPQPGMTFENSDSRMWKVDHLTIRVQYIAALLVSPFLVSTLSLVDEDNNGKTVLEIGLGGGSLDMFLHTMNPNINITAVELDPVVVKISQKWFDVVENSKRKTLVEDGLKFIDKEAENDKKYDVIYLDACDSSHILPCPSKIFRNTKTYENLYKIVKENGVLVINILSYNQEKDEAAEIIKMLMENFSTCIRVTLQSETNIIAICTRHIISASDSNIDFLKRRALAVTMRLGLHDSKLSVLMWIIGLVLLIHLAHENVVSAKTFMTNEISMPFDARKKVQNDIPTIIWNNQSPQPIPNRIKSSRFERLRGAEVLPIQVRPAVVEIPTSPKIEVVPAAPESSPIEVEKSEVVPSKIIEVEKEIETPEPKLHEHEASVREVSIHEARQFVAAAPIEEVKPAAVTWGSPPIDFASEVVPTEVAEFEEAEIVPTIPENYAKIPEIETREPIKQIYPISEKSSKFSEVEEATEEPTTTTKKPKKLKKRKRKNRKTTTTTTTTVTLPITTTTVEPTTVELTTFAPTTESTTPSTTSTTSTTPKPLPITTITSLPAIQIQTLSKHGESYLGGWNEEISKNDKSTLGNIMNQLSEVPSSISLTDDEAVRAYYKKYYEEWYRQHNIAMPTEVPSEVVTSATPRKISIQLGSRNQASSSNTAAASNPFGIDSNSTVPTKEQLVKICEYVEKISKSFGIKDPVTFAKNNCAFVKNFHPNATCEQVQEVMAYCSSRVYSAES
ncbi:unnamed protein product [Caenorhabditis angaria]|uniref:aECM cysteine-cradle domain-containing protein n=1 Tax=Caenorhabditis angaria TaxID=860376 RepID=A0A9P1J0T4_9PELO|nr:unnamed protein product [Caenorhabditis angaria]